MLLIALQMKLLTVPLNGVIDELAVRSLLEETYRPKRTTVLTDMDTGRPRTLDLGNSSSLGCSRHTGSPGSFVTIISDCISSYDQRADRWHADQVGVILLL